MTRPGQVFRATVAVLLAALLACPPASALVALNDGHDRIYLSGTLSATHDSNVYANNEGRGDIVYSTGIVAEYTRRAGWIGVNGAVGITSAEFAELKEENYQNPNFSLEFTKQSGRTTGSLSLSAARESRADAAVNLRSSSWNYTSTLNFKYPMAGAYTLTGSVGYTGREYVEETALANLYTYTASLDLLRIMGAERDAMVGYRYRYNETSFDTSTIDHSATVGLSGKLIRGIMGALRVGYQMRSFQGSRDGDGSFRSWTASASASRALSKKASLGLQLSKDFSITASDSSVDVSAASLDLQYAFSSRWGVSGSASWGRSRFLGEKGRLVLAIGPPPVLGPSRVDTYASWDAGLHYSLNEHFKVALSYVWFQNWSTSSYADFVRSSWSASVSSRW